jgi:hypothetical protein
MHAMGGEVICSHCTLAGSSSTSIAAIIIALLGAAGGIWGAWNGYRAHQASQRNRTRDIVKEEFAPFRNAIENYLLSLEEEHDTLKGVVLFFER